jgi:hypothetical protein
MKIATADACLTNGNPNRHHARRTSKRAKHLEPTQLEPPSKEEAVQLTTGSQALGARHVTKVLLADDTQTPLPLLILGAGLALAIAVIHLQDQGGLLGDQSPTWLKYGYYMIELSSTISAALIIRGKVFGWLLGLASSIGPLTGYIVSRTVGVPGDPGDVGNWGYLLGTVSLIVEGSFIFLAAICLLRIWREWQS